MGGTARNKKIAECCVNLSRVQELNSGSDGRTDRHGCLVRKGQHSVASLALVFQM
jgi:hypothetical protein